VNIEPLISNTGIDAGDTLYIDSNSYDCSDTTVQGHITTLEGRSLATFEHDC